MHFVSGGAFNGKSKWVRQSYQLQGKVHTWKSAYKGDSLHELSDESLIVFEGLEIWLKKAAAGDLEPKKIRENWKAKLAAWLRWEREDNGRNLILIGSDVTKGIVPLTKEDRQWRDLTGWVYQDVAAAADTVDVIWYGISQNLKQRGNDHEIVYTNRR